MGCYVYTQENLDVMKARIEQLEINCFFVFWAGWDLRDKSAVLKLYKQAAFVEVRKLRSWAWLLYCLSWSTLVEACPNDDEPVCILSSILSMAAPDGKLRCLFERALIHSMDYVNLTSLVVYAFYRTSRIQCS
jgi:hypothetical protein